MKKEANNETELTLEDGIESLYPILLVVVKDLEAFSHHHLFLTVSSMSNSISTEKKKDF